MMHANIIECFETINISTNQKIDGVINVIFYLMSKVVGYLPPNITPYFIYKLATNITKHVLHQNVLHWVVTNKAKGQLIIARKLTNILLEDTISNIEFTSLMDK